MPENKWIRKEKEKGSKVTAATKKEETGGGNQNNSFKNGNNLEENIIKERDLEIEPLPLSQKLPSQRLPLYQPLK